MSLENLRKDNFNQWYQDVVKEAELAEFSTVRGCMILKPWGYGIWELIQKELDSLIKETDHENVYFPLLIPKSFLEQEAEHIEGFAKECAVVTHHRLEQTDQGLQPRGELAEPLIIRPTSETLIGSSFAKWIQSYRDLPLKINQWANVMRWEMRPRLLLRTAEFLWQEGHTAHATAEEAEKEARLMHQVYESFFKKTLALPFFSGEKTPDEKFPGATRTYTLEVMSQNGKAIQSATSHFLGQSFSKAFKISYDTSNGKEEFVWTTSWGTSTRLLGALVMSHSDDEGLILPPSIAPIQIFINPLRDKGQKEKVESYCEEMKSKLKKMKLLGHPLRVKINSKPLAPGEIYWKSVRQGIPIFLEIGPKDVEKESVTAYVRTDGPKRKQNILKRDLPSFIRTSLKSQQKEIYEKASIRMKDQTLFLQKKEDFQNLFQSESNACVEAFWHPDAMNDDLLKELQVTPRCLLKSTQKGTCLLTSQPTNQKVIYAKSY